MGAVTGVHLAATAMTAAMCEHLAETVWSSTVAREKKKKKKTRGVGGGGLGGYYTSSIDRLYDNLIMCKYRQRYTFILQVLV